MENEQSERTDIIEDPRLIAFGPVPSRRLGRSLGINNIPPKVCTYSCAYCQVGRTLRLQIDRQEFYEPQQIFREVAQKIEKTVQTGEPVDYLTFVPDGEPTLDVNLGCEIDLLRSLGIKIAIITNASLLWREDVVDELNRADWVSVKVDSVIETSWRRLNRPHAGLKFRSILDGVIRFANYYDGEFVTETMLLKDINDDDDSVNELSRFLAHLRASKTYLSIPTRPPAEHWASLPSETDITRAYQILTTAVDSVELLTGYEGNAFAQTGDVRKDLLAITAVHPMREEAVWAYLARAKRDWAVVDHLIGQGLLVETEYNGRKFYVRRLPERRQ